MDPAKDDPDLLSIYNWLMAEFDNGRRTSIVWEALAPSVAQHLGSPRKRAGMTNQPPR